MLTINTNKGLFRPTRLQFGVHSSSGIFQRELENWFAHVPFVKVRSDVILIPSKNGTGHLENVRQVLRVIRENGLHLKFGKCVFMTDEVIYLGFKINKNGVTPVKEKNENIRTTKEPHNISQLKLFLGLINYYYHYF